MAFLPQTPRQKKILLWLVLILAFIAVDIYFGTQYSAQRDTNFRAFRWDTETLWALKSNYEGTAWGVSVHTNSAGFRGGEEYPLQSQHKLRIVTLGDSRAYGFGVKDEETFTHVLQETLRQRGVDAEAINAGVHGFSAVQCRARLRQMLRYKPNAVIIAPGYNDRRYLVIRAVDSDSSLAWIARIRRVVDVLQWSNTLFAFMYEAGKRKLEILKQNPPPLDQVEVRVPEETFRQELVEMADLCRENQIQPVFLRIYQDPGAFALVEKADLFYRQGDYNEAQETIEEAYNTIPDRAYSMSRWVLGRAYQKLGEEEKARKEFANHQPIGSIFGENVLRSEAVYFSIFEKIAKEKNVPLADARQAMVGNGDDPRQAEDAFRTFFSDECHYTAEGNRKMGEALAEIFMKN